MKNELLVTILLTLATSLFACSEERTPMFHIGAGIITDTRGDKLSGNQYNNWIQGVSISEDYSHPVSKKIDIYTSLYTHVLHSESKVFSRYGADIGVSAYQKHITNGSSTVNLALTAYLHKPVFDAASNEKDSTYRKQLGITVGSNLKLSDNVMIKSRITQLFKYDDAQETLLFSSSLQFAPPEQ
jgi:hypothetical protein